MVDTLKNELSAKLAVVFFLVITIWWVILYSSGVQQTFHNYLFGAIYGLICILGGLSGLLIANKWGGISSLIGKAIIVLSLGLLTQEFGQLVFSYYNIILNVEVPYPSLADIGFFGTIPFYIYGMSLLASASGAKFSLRTVINQIQIVLIPAAMLIVSYLFFLRTYEFDFNNPLKLFLDFGYPFGEALYISVAILTFSLSWKLLGGIMKSKILFLIFAFVVQYIADFNFLYQSSQQTWVNGGYGDYIYFVAYTLMAFGLIQLGSVIKELKAKD